MHNIYEEFIFLLELAYVSCIYIMELTGYLLIIIISCILATLLGSSKNSRLEVTPFSVPATSGTVSAIRRDEKRGTSGLTALGSLNTCLMCEG